MVLKKLLASNDRFLLVGQQEHPQKNMPRSMPSQMPKERERLVTEQWS